jgi:hypothetical protein
MGDFVNDWVRCNICFKGFEGAGGMLTNCGHFFCNRPPCKLPCASGEKTKCPICKSDCGAISLSDSLPPEVLQFFEDPEVLCQRAMDVMRFQAHQKELSRAHLSESQTKLDSLQTVVEDLRAENRELQQRLGKLARMDDQPIVQSECLIPGIIPGKAAAKRRSSRRREDIFEFPKPDDEEKVATTTAKSGDAVAKLFTPTLASRLQSLTGKKMYSPVHNHG